MSIVPQKRSYAEIKNKKEERKQWREEKLIKKAEKALKKKQQEEEQQQAALIAASSKTKIKKELSTISIAVPGSILDNAQSMPLRVYLAGQVARAACIYKVDEVIVFDDLGEITENDKKKVRMNDLLGEGRICCLQMARILQYLECPQYLRKMLFPLHADLKDAGVLNPLDAPHHLRQHDVSIYREGVISNKPTKPGKGSYANIGLYNDVIIDKTLDTGLRITVKIPPNQPNPKKMHAEVVSPRAPKFDGYYWGYSVRLASNLSDVFNKCPYKEGYDLTIGTSDKGESIDQIPQKSMSFNHALIVFGGLSGLEAAMEADPNLDMGDPSSLFQHYLNTCPIQGSRTIRTEEAILVSLAELRNKLSAKYPTPEVPQFENAVTVNSEQSSNDTCYAYNSN